MVHWLIAPGLILLAFSVLTAAAEVDSDQSRFLRTALSLAEQREENAAFASIAISELAESFFAEADLARREARGSEESGAPPNAAKLQTWSGGVDRYAEQLLLVLEDIDTGFPVTLRNPHGQVVTVSVGGRNVILAHPRSDQQPAYEQRVLSSFCASHQCSTLTEEEVERVPIPVTAVVLEVEWSFTGSGPVCRHRGIAVQFPSGANVSRARTLCQQLLQEASSLAAELSWQQRHGVSVEWERLEIRTTPARPEHLVLLNGSGDSLLLTLPVIYASPGLLQALQPWLASRYRDEQPASVHLDAEAFGWR